MGEYTYVTLRKIPERKDAAAEWFHEKWGVPMEAYLECMEAYLNRETEYGWEFLCMAQGDFDSEMSRIYVHNQYDSLLHPKC